MADFMWPLRLAQVPYLWWKRVCSRHATIERGAVGDDKAASVKNRLTNRLTDRAEETPNGLTDPGGRDARDRISCQEEG